jgi:peptidyl-prolyl cis-trans isomerase A (cyclophilin A)
MRALSWMVVLLLAGCGVSEEQYKQMMAERDQYKAKVKELEDQLDMAKGDMAKAKKDLDKASSAPGRPPEAQVAAARSQLKLEASGKLKATLKTNQGEIRCELWPDVAPETVLNFVGLAEGTKEWTEPGGTKVKKPLYNGTKFHRVIKNFMIQGGDPLGNGSGGPGYKFGDEVWKDVRFDKPGALAMANAGPGTNGSQFFITTPGSRPTHLNMKHTIFGECELETVAKIAEVAVGGPQGSTPVQDVVLEKVTIMREAGAPAGEPPKAQ